MVARPEYFVGSAEEQLRYRVKPTPDMASGMPCRPRAWSSRRAPGGGCCTGDKPWPGRHPRYRALWRACSSGWTQRGCTGRGRRFAWQPDTRFDTRLLPGWGWFCETSRAPIASIGGGLRGLVGCRDTHPGLVDHEQHDQNPSSTSSAARSKARAFASVSCHSSSGTESATTPAAACT